MKCIHTYRFYLLPKLHRPETAKQNRLRSLNTRTNVLVTTIRRNVSSYIANDRKQKLIVLMSSREVCFLVKVSVDQDQWSNQCPHIKANADPAGGDLHPHRWPPACHGLIGGVRAADIEKHP